MSEPKISLALAFIKTHPESVAKILEQHDPKDVAEFIADIPRSYASPVIQAMLPLQSARFCRRLDPESVAGLLRHLPASRIVAILRQIKKESRAAIIRELPTKVEISCTLLLNYSTEMVGAWMTPHVITIPYECTASEAITYVKAADVYAYTDYVFAVERDGQLKGRIRMTELLLASPNTYLSAITEPCSFTVTGRSLIYPLSKHSEWNAMEALPVLNKHAQLIGVLRHVELRKYLDKPLSDGAAYNSDDGPLIGIFQIYGHCLKSLIHSMKDCIESDIRS
ncbi:magnesium transporter MgtE N-terminal domain-containing protein [Coraliomargarita sp. W4R72]